MKASRVYILRTGERMRHLWLPGPSSWVKLVITSFWWPAEADEFLNVRVKLLQLCMTSCNPMDYSPPGSSVHGIFQARILELFATSSSREYSWPCFDRQVFVCLFVCLFLTTSAPLGSPIILFGSSVNVSWMSNWLPINTSWLECFGALIYEIGRYDF